MKAEDLPGSMKSEGEHLVVEERNGLVEAVHRCHVAVVDREGKLRYSSGNPNHVTYTRSCIKPIQALPVLYLGAADRFGFDEREIAMCASSHSGEKVHVDLIKDMMNKIKISEEDLKCGGHAPFHKPTARKLSGKYTKVHDNCSGKHTASLAVCKHMGWDLESYTDTGHPLNGEMVSLISGLVSMEEKDIHVGKDGCDIPNYAIPISKMAQLFAILADPPKSDLKEDLERMRDAFSNHPHLIAGTDRFDTVLMEDLKGKVLSKAGAAGLQTVAVRIGKEWLGISLKIEDGSYPAVEVLTYKVLSELGTEDPEERGKRYSHRKLETRSNEKVGRVMALGRLAR